MTLDETLLEKLSVWRPGGTRSGLSADGGPGQPSVTLTADHNDLLACRVWELQLNRKEPVENLKDWASRLAARPSGLLESLRLIELDTGRQVAQLRSEEPAPRGEAVQYYEILLHGSGEAHVRRFQGSGAGKREQVPFVLTHEVVSRLVRDLAS